MSRVSDTKFIKCKLIPLLMRQGWRVRLTGKHYTAYPADPTQPIVMIPLTPSDWRGTLNLLADLRRRGADIPRTLKP